MANSRSGRRAAAAQACLAILRNRPEIRYKPGDFSAGRHAVGVREIKPQGFCAVRRSRAWIVFSAF
jgi:hypothetical protein